MKHDWSPEELAGHFTLTRLERDFLGFKSDAALLSLAALLKLFQLQGQFPERPQAVPGVIVDLLARQLAVDSAVWTGVDWTSRTARRHREEVAAFCGFRAFRAADESELIAHLAPLVADLNPYSEGLKQQGLTFLRGQRLVPLPAERLARFFVPP